MKTKLFQALQNKQLNRWKQMLSKEVRIFNSVISKLNSNPDKIKLTKEEKTKLLFQLGENVKHLQSKVDKAWFLTKWFYKNMLNQYQSIIYKLNA